MSQASQEPSQGTTPAATVIPLKFPIQSGGNRIEQLTMRRGTRKDMKDAHKYSPDEADQEDFLFSRLCGVTLEDIDALDLADSKALQDAFRAMVGE